MGRKKQGKGKATKKLRGPTVVSASDAREELLKKAPHTFIFHRGQVGKSVQELTMDLRRVMEPFTASRLKVRKKNVLKDFVSVAGPLSVTHFMVLSRSELHIQLRVIRLPRGPTLTFRLNKYSLGRDVVSTLKHHNMEPKQFQHHPLLVMNNFSGDGMHLKLMSTMFQNMLPSINVSKVKLGEIRRCVLLNFNPEDQTLDFRHYNIRAVPVGMSKGVKKLVKAKVPNLSRFDDVSDFLLRGGDLSESEAELDGDHNEVVLPQDLGSRGNVKSAKSAIRLTEIGPRMELQLVKIEDGVGEGEVLYHSFVQKTEEEIAATKQKREKRKQQKILRKKKQEENVQKKLDKKEELKQKSLAGLAKKSNSGEQDDSSKPESSDEDDDDAEYFRQEVGEEPEKELFPDKKSGKKRKPSENRGHLPFKKKKMNATPNVKSKSYESTGKKFRRNGGKDQKGQQRGMAKKKDNKSFKSKKSKRPQGKRKR